MSEARLRPTLPRPTPPPAPVTVTITGTILYPKGPWGSNRPVRNRAAVLVYEAEIFDPMNIPKGKKRPTGPFEHRMTTERNVVQVFNKTGRSWEVFTESDGTFRITTNPMHPHTYNLLLEIRDYNFVSVPGRNVEVCIYDLRGSIQLVFPTGSIPFSSQGVGTLRVPWPPPLFMTQLAVVNTVAFVDTQKLSRRLSEIVSSPSYPTTIKLNRESALSQYNVTGEDFTHAQKLFQLLVNGRLAAGFPERVVENVSKISRLNVKEKSTAAAIAAILDRLVSINIEELEKKEVLTPLLNALSNALGDPTAYSDPTDDAAPDMAAACAMLAVAGLMVNGAKPSVTYSSRDLSNRQKMLAVDISMKK